MEDGFQAKGQKNLLRVVLRCRGVVLWTAETHFVL